MLSVVLAVHSVNRWAVLVVGLIVFITIVLRPPYPDLRSLHFSKFNRATGGMLLGLNHLQALLGVALLGLSPLPKAAVQAGDALWETPILWFFVVAHPAIMILAVVIMQLGWRRAKRSEDPVRGRQIWRRTLICWGALLLFAIPWPGLAYGRDLF